jgi:hypothetical protein
MVKTFIKKLLLILAIIILSPIILAVIILALLAHYTNRLLLLLQVRLQWIPKRKFVLLVCSDNPEWRNYVEREILPPISVNIVFLNWSDRQHWPNGTLETKLFKHYWGKAWLKFRGRAGGHEFNHVAIVFKPWYHPKKIDFWQAWKNHKFGKDEELNKLKQELFGAFT